jgi:hypothetical protein
MLCQVHLAISLTVLVDIVSGYTGRCKSNYHTITTTPTLNKIHTNNSEYKFNANMKLLRFNKSIISLTFQILYIHRKKPFSIEKGLTKAWRYQRGNSQKDRQHNGQNKKDKRTNNDLKNTTQKTKDRVTRTQRKTEDEFGCSGRVSSSCSSSGRVMIDFVI